jgi:tRNA (cytidine/uridine-2'-O-)-methyltransferase
MPPPNHVTRSVSRSADPMRIALYQPDIPQNAGTILRLCACLGIEAHIIEPSGFPTTDRAFRRAGMDYLDAVAIVRHRSWQDFASWRSREGHRLILFTTAATASYLDYRYRPDDILLFGRESAGVPSEVHGAADARLRIPIREGLRSLNVAVAAALAVGEALRQTGDMK